VDSVCDAGVELIPTTVGMLLGQLLGCDLGRRASAARDQLHYNRSRSAPGGIRTPNLLIRVALSNHGSATVLAFAPRSPKTAPPEALTVMAGPALVSESGTY